LDPMPSSKNYWIQAHINMCPPSIHDDPQKYAYFL
jgi:hypothetical protein